MKYTPRLPSENVNVSRTSPLKELAILVGGLMACCAAAYLILGFLVDMVVSRIPPEMEHRLAGPLLATLEKPRHQTARAEAIQHLADKLRERCVNLPYPTTVYVSEEEAVNALALPGGAIVLFRGLIDQVGSENALMFVLAHEMGHFANRDHLRGMGRALVLFTLSVAIFGTDSRVSDLVAFGLNLNALHYSREREIQADAFALQSVGCVYGHLTGATDLFEDLKAGEGKTPAIGHYLSTHPAFAVRLQRLHALKQEMNLPSGRRAPLPDALSPARDG